MEFERACKPGFVEDDHLSTHTHCCAALAAIPGRSAGSIDPPLFGLAPGGVYQASVSRRSWWSLTPPFQLSCALSEGFSFLWHFPYLINETVAASNHLALWSPDFPPQNCWGDHPARSTCYHAGRCCSSCTQPRTQRGIMRK